MLITNRDDQFLFSLGLENPASKVIYEGANKEVEKITKWFYFAFVKASTMTAVLPKLIETLYSHLATDNGTYQLPFIMWYVSRCFQCVWNSWTNANNNSNNWHFHQFFPISKGLHLTGEHHGVMWWRLEFCG